MTILLQLVAAVGWRGLIAGVVGAALSAVAAYPAGRLVERAVCKERIVRRLAEVELQNQETRNARIQEALDARRTVRHGNASAADGGLPDDGFRRD
ncbi:hypothetical protein RDV64_16730 [Acuticoccus sp. MNP-M23]|uniref:hypothetical protein n=1 Tax=Acuticoccus sp. MNP-M23 TaxID=3072793 RepID=UPI00281683BF|nr:hypothetical protein [Acuticoccus sp. MNP-M23]WMS41706.1 hypothetical protein RDV64_16730 [Acuticoccus sp. MNP-M23]